MCISCCLTRFEAYTWLFEFVHEQFYLNSDELGLRNTYNCKRPKIYIYPHQTLKHCTTSL